MTQQNADSGTRHRQGLLYGVVGILILSPDALVLRWIDCDIYALIALRCAFIALASGLWALAVPALRRGFAWCPVLHYAVWFAAGAALFPLSVKHTHVANVLVIISAAPLAAAVGARWFLKEKTAKQTWAAAAVVAAGVAWIFSAEVGGGGALGNVFALGVVLVLAANSIIVRRWREVAFVPALALGGAIGAAAFAGFADWSTVDGRDFALTAANGGIIMTLTFILVIAAAKRLPPAEVNLLFLLETVLGPLWVWLALDEVPPPTTFAAAALILPALTAHAVWSLRRGRS